MEEKKSLPFGTVIKHAPTNARGRGSDGYLCQSPVFKSYERTESIPDQQKITTFESFPVVAVSNSRTASAFWNE